MSETPPAQDDIQHMLREAQHGSEITDEFARVCLRLFHRACQEVVTWHRTLGRRYFLEGHEPEALKRIVDQDIEQIAGILDWLKQPRGVDGQLPYSYFNRIGTVRGDSDGIGDFPMEYLRDHSGLPMGDENGVLTTA